MVCLIFIVYFMPEIITPESDMKKMAEKHTGKSRPLFERIFKDLNTINDMSHVDFNNTPGVHRLNYNRKSGVYVSCPLPLQGRHNTRGVFEIINRTDGVKLDLKEITTHDGLITNSKK